jgi:galactosamine-6-phosphate isomerase
MEKLHFQPGMGYIGGMEIAFGSGLRIQVLDFYEAMSRDAADLICRELKQKPNLLLCVSAGATPTRTYELLAARYGRQPKLFNRLRVVQIDEWGGLAPGDPATCAEDLRTKLLEPLGIARNRFTGFRTDSPDPQADCRRIGRWLASHGPIDICILGLGTNGHVAMNEPAEVITPHAHVATLAESSRKHGMLKDLARKPRYGLTLGMADILRSRRILLLVSGKPKRPALKRLMKPEVTTQFPASFLWLHPDATVLCDRAAAGGSSVRRSP